MFATPVNLNAGTYWLGAYVKSTAGTQSFNWGATTNPINTGTLGTADLALYYSSGGPSPVLDNTESYMYKFSGFSSPPGVPEPGTVGLALIGGGVLGLRAWRRRRTA